jgi:ATP-dependent RNA helicase DeaD
MPGLIELHLAPPVASLLEAWGYTADDAGLREQAPGAARGNNLVLAVPPAARYAAPAFAGLVSALTRGGLRALILAPAPALAEWAEVLLPLAEAAGLRAHVAYRAARATRLLREAQVEILLTAPSTAADLLARSALKLEALQYAVLAWPDLYPSDELVTSLMQEVPRECCRIIQPAAPGARPDLVERYARRAFTTGPLVQPDSMAARPPVRTVHVAWGQRGAALPALLEVLDPANAVIWAADRASAGRAAAVPLGRDIMVVTGDAPPAPAIVAWDLPAPSRLAQLAAAGEVVLLVPPHGSGYVARIAGKQQALRLPGAPDDAHDQAAARRAAIERIIEQEDLTAELVTLAPLFERRDPALVAAALQRLTGSAKIEPAAGTGVAQVWIGVGRKDEASPNDIVAALTKEVGVDRTKIGRIEIRELYSLVELPASEAEDICRRLSGRTIRRRRVVARLDRHGSR